MYDSIIILGPTASGKTKTSINLAKSLNAEIVNADSMYIYKNMNIGTAKPTIDEMQGIKHHLIDIINPNDRFTVAEYRLRAKDIINTLYSKNIVPVIVGGTGFYIDSLINDYTYAGADADMKIREKYENLAKTYGNEYVYNILKECDLESASKLHYNDLKRVIRALEIYELSGNTKNQNNETKTEAPVLKNPLIIGLNFDRTMLYNKINQRVDIMLDSGLINEVKKLIDMSYSEDLQSMKAIGYKEIISYLSNECTLDEAVDKIKQHTRNYAKRQLTYFRRNDRIVWLDPTKHNELELNNLIIDLFNKIS